MDEDEIYYFDTRNAEPMVVSRGGNNRGVITTSRSGGGMSGGMRPGTRVTRGPMAGNRYGSSYANPYMVGSTAAEYGAMGGSLGGLFAGTTPGQLIDVIAQIFAAVMPLPSAPTATTDPATDIGNLITYQSALASYAKRDEQVRTIGNLVTKLIG
ncbi:MAG TPA: hypothetical protein VGG28_20260 [Kofleriaceae bacterium]|jgi:hypothetical protein